MSDWLGLESVVERDPQPNLGAAAILAAEVDSQTARDRLSLLDRVRDRRRRGRPFAILGEQTGDPLLRRTIRRRRSEDLAWSLPRRGPKYIIRAFIRLAVAVRIISPRQQLVNTGRVSHNRHIVRIDPLLPPGNRRWK